jgi:hypothetical protein
VPTLYIFALLVLACLTWVVAGLALLLWSNQHPARRA